MEHQVQDETAIPPPVDPRWWLESNPRPINWQPNELTARIEIRCWHDPMLEQSIVLRHKCTSCEKVIPVLSVLSVYYVFHEFHAN